MNMKICIIGAGSPYTPEIIERLNIMRGYMPVGEIMLTDTDEKRLDSMLAFCQRFSAHLGLDIKITKTADHKEAISGSSFIVTQIRVGGNAARAKDERTCVSMGLLGQETTGAVGFAKAMRTVPVMLDIAKDAEELAPDAWIINYTNPTGIIAEAVINHSKMKIAGLCAGGMFARNWTAQALKVNPEDVRYDFAGLNHMNVAYNITVKGRPLTDEEFALAAANVWSVDTELILKLRALPSPYMQYYFHRERTVRELKEAQKTRGETVLELEKELFDDFANPEISTKPESLNKRGGGGYSEIAIAVSESIYNNRDMWTVANVPNNGVLSFLPDKAVIETPCLVNATGLMPVIQSPPPVAVWGLIAAVKNYEMLTVEAAITGNKDTALWALVAHPLIGDYDVAKKLLEKLGCL
jgi:6-phospho-beta-glucosidase